jgi:hypothetical protein
MIDSRWHLPGLALVDQVRGLWVHETQPDQMSMSMPNLEFDLAHSSVKLLRRERHFVSGQMCGLELRVAMGLDLDMDHLHVQLI